ncbi:MAG TPA: hypothetical protein V6D17_02280 [Candidatus Obscuribacterales bacterium]
MIPFIAGDGSAGKTVCEEGVIASHEQGAKIWQKHIDQSRCRPNAGYDRR